MIDRAAIVKCNDVPGQLNESMNLRPVGGNIQVERIFAALFRGYRELSEEDKHLWFVTWCRLGAS